MQDLLKSHTALITDFSSVAWDFSYLHKPVMYFQFDQADLVGARAPARRLRVRRPPVVW